MVLGTTELIVDHARPFVEIHFPEADRRAIAWLDTGGGAVILGAALARDLGAETTVEEIDGEQHAVVALPEVHIGGVSLDTSQAIAVGTQADLIVEGFRAEAFIPARVIAQHDVVFDYPGGAFSLDQAGEPVGTRVDARSYQRPGTGWPAATVNIAGEDVNLLLDTGASCCMLSERLLDRLGAKVVGRAAGAFGLANMTAGPLDTRVETVRLPDLVWGDARFPSVIAVSRPEGNFEQMMSSAMPLPVEGAIAGNVLRHLRIEWRPSEQAVWIDAPTLHTEELAQVPLVLYASEGAIRVVGLGDGADDMGFRVGDGVVSVNGVRVGASFGDTVRMLGGSPGERRVVEVAREGNVLGIDDA